jgi:hypothetical protein
MMKWKESNLRLPEGAEGNCGVRHLLGLQPVVESRIEYELPEYEKRAKI